LYGSAGKSDVDAAGARFEVGGTVGAAPRWIGTAMNFTFSGPDLAPFQDPCRGYGLPAGPFQAHGAFEYGDSRVSLQNVTITAAGSEAQISTDFALPLGATLGAGRTGSMFVQADRISGCSFPTCPTQA